MRTSTSATRFARLKKAACLLALTGLGLFAGNQAQAQILGASATITVNDTSISPTSINAAPAAICNGSSTTLTVQGGELGTGASWVWYKGGCGTGTSIGSGTTLTVAPPNTGTSNVTTTYYVRAEGGACNYTTSCAQVTITTYPTPVVTAPPAIAYCNGATAPAIALSGTPTGVVYAISGGAAIGLADATNLTQIPSFTALNTGTAPVNATISVTPSANGCTGTTVTYVITVLPTATVNAIASQVKCNGTASDAIAFTSPSTGGTVTYDWTNDASAIGIAASGTGDIASVNLVNATCTDVVAHFTVTPVYTVGANNCTGTPATFTITVHPTPNGTLAGGTICEGQPATLTFNATCGATPFSLNIQPTGVPGGLQTYPGVISGTPFNVTPTPTTTTTYDLMKITDANGCIKQ